MSNLKHTLGILGAGVLAFGLIFVAHELAPAAPKPVPVTKPTPPVDVPGADAPATTEDLLGRWKADPKTNENGFVEFTEYDSWFASDGCNSSSGGWSIGDDGEITTTGGVSTLIFCENAPTIQAASTAKTVTINGAGDELTVTTTDGQDIMLTRVNDTPISVVGKWIAPGDATRFTYLQFEADGTWYGGSDSCFGPGGKWDVTRQPVVAGETQSLARDGDVTLNIGAKAADQACTGASANGLMPPITNDHDYAVYFADGTMSLFDMQGKSEIPVKLYADPSFHR